MIRSGFLMVMTAATLGVTLAPAASAQQGAKPVVEQAAGFRDEELRSFAVVVLEVQRINTAYLPRFEAADTVAEQDKVVNAAEAEVQRAIRDQGMSMSRFQEILAHTQINDEVADRVRRYMKEAR